MKAKRKVVKKINWTYFVSHIAFIMAIVLFFQQLNIPGYGVLGLAIYLLLSVYMKIVIPRFHNKGLFYIRKGEFEGAIFAFRNSYQFFSKNKWLDDFRAFTLLSTSSFSYKEMALMNIIFCHEKLGDTRSAKLFHDQLSKEFPNNPYCKQV